MADDLSLENGHSPIDDEEHLPNTATQTGTGPTPRLLITKLILENFKSYAGVKEIGPFQKCFSSIVGPNGSGKSNVIDAMLFVFGKRAKKLRLNKVSELIHKSDAVKDAQFARVSVYFEEIIDTGDGDDDYEVIPNTERVVTRIARKDNSSCYKLDGKNCAFKDVAAYLGSKGIDLDNNRFLILQGEVEMISMMPPKGKTESDEGLLEYLEDIIGSSKYVEETNQAALKVESMETLRQEKLNRVKAVEKEKDNLEGARQEAEALLAQEREIRRKKNILYQIHKMKADKTSEKLTGQKQAIVEKLSAARERLANENERVEEIESGLSQQRKGYDKIHAELKKTKEEFLAYERRDVQLREEIKHAKAQLKKLEAKIATEDRNETEANVKREQAKQAIPELETKIEELNAKKESVDRKVEQILEERKGETEALREDLEVKTKELAPLKQERGIHQAAFDTAQGAVDILEESANRAKAKLEASEKELASLDSKQQSKKNELVKCQEELDAAKKRIVEAEVEEKELGAQEATLASRSKTLMARVEDAKANLQSAGSGRSSAVTNILKAAKNGGELSKIGIIGRLGDLATIPEKYDVAVTTACGMLDHIVVQSTEAAQKCLEFLRKHNLGRANFIPLEKLKKGAHDRAVETPEGAPRLFELISPGNPVITPAIYLAVGNTLVAPDLETATRWAYDFNKRWRVVSLDGSLIETAGTMSGGGKSVRRGGMRLANSRNAIAAGSSGDELMLEDCEKLESELKRTLESLQDCRKRRQALVEEIQSLKKKVKALHVQLPKYSMDVADCDTTREQLTKTIPQLRTQCKLSKEELDKLEELNKKVQECKKNLDSSALTTSKLEGEIASLQKSILDAGGPELKKQQALCKKIVSETREAEGKLNSERVSVTKLEKAAKKAMEAKASAVQGLESCKQTLEKKQVEINSLDEDAAEVMKAFERVKVEEAEQREKLEAVSKECETLKQSQSEIKCIEIDLLVQAEGFEKQIAECSKKSKHWSTEIKKLLAAAKEDDDDYASVDDTEGDGPPVGLAQEDDDGDAIMEDKDEEAPQDTNDLPDSQRSPLPTFSFETLEKYDVEAVGQDIEVLESERSALAKNANMGAIAEYRKKEADYLSRVAELDEVTKEQSSARKHHENLRRLRLEMFMDGFGKITLKLKEMYQMITLGGDAELELVDSLDPFSEGIVFSVRPPKKSWKNISNLSGGEKTLSSLALVFALHHFKPTPLYVMDEIDAALDFKNVSIVANYIKERTKDAQFIIISLRNNMFELADRLVGIYKTNNCTKSVTINPKAFGVSGQQDGVLIRKNVALLDKTNETDSGRHVSFIPIDGNGG